MKTWLTLFLILQGLLVASLVTFWISGLATWAFIALWSLLPLILIFGAILFFKTFKRKSTKEPLP